MTTRARIGALVAAVVTAAGLLLTPFLTGTAAAAPPPRGCASGFVCVWEREWFQGEQETLSCSQSLRSNTFGLRLRRVRPNTASSIYNGCSFPVGLTHVDGATATGTYMCVRGSHRMSAFTRLGTGFDNRATHVGGGRYGGGYGGIACSLSRLHGNRSTY